MNIYIFYFIIVVIFNYFLSTVLAENNFYIISIRRSKNDKNYDDADEEVQEAIDELTNDRMNDIFEIISDNTETYRLPNGKMDEKLNELSKTTKLLRKRSEDNLLNNKKFKLQFINRYRPQHLRNGKTSKNSSSRSKSKSVKEEKVNENIEYIPIESNLVDFICPILNTYAILAYLSDDLIDEVKKLDNIVSIEKSIKTAPLQQNIDDDDNYICYEKEDIINETKWKDLSVQENLYTDDVNFTHLSLISQNKHDNHNNTIYDNNYYYPSSAGKGIDIYFIDSGLDVSVYENEFNSYEGTPDERTISCDGIFMYGRTTTVYYKKECTEIKGHEHGNFVSIAALGSKNGVAKKANLHMLEADYEVYQELRAIDYVK